MNRTVFCNVVCKFMKTIKLATYGKVFFELFFRNNFFTTFQLYITIIFLERQINITQNRQVVFSNAKSLSQAPTFLYLKFSSFEFTFAVVSQLDKLIISLAKSYNLLFTRFIRLLTPTDAFINFSIFSGLQCLAILLKSI